MTTRQPNDRAALLEQAIRRKRAAAGLDTPTMMPRPADQPACLSEIQRGLWLLNQMDPHSPAYNLTSAFRVGGTLDPEKLERALNEVVSRHRILRSTFRRQGETVLQVVHSHSPLALEVVEAEDGEGLAATVDEASKPFDLETGPLIRLQLVEESSKKTRYLLLVLHHILADEKSLALLWQELGEAYRSRQDATEPAVQYDDYVYSLSLREPAERDRQLEDWRRRLEPLPDDLRFPFERSPSEGLAGRGRLLSRALPEPVLEGLRNLASSSGATPFLVAACAFRLLLQRYTDNQRVAFATPVSTRSHPATARMIGYFTNPVVIPTHLDEQQPVLEAVQGFSRQLRALLVQASLPFQSLAEALSPRRQRDRHPIFQIMFVHQESIAPPELGEARLEPLALDLGASKFDLTLFVTEGQRELEIALEYRLDRYDQTWMERLLDHYGTLLEQLPTDPNRTLAKVSMLGTEEQRSLLALAKGTELDADKMTLLPREILDRVSRSPQSPALSCGDSRRSYGELEASARRIATKLVDCGVNVGDRVGVFLNRSVEMVEAVLGVHLAGAAYVPLDPTYPESRNRTVLEDADVAAVLTTASRGDELWRGPWATIEVDRIDTDGARGAVLPGPSADSPAYILYTSGSSGRPKGVVVTQANLRASTAARLQVYEKPPRRFLLLPSIAFDSSVAGLFWTLAMGGCLVIPSDEEALDPRRLARLVARERVSSLLCVPSLYAQLLRADGGLLDGLETVIVAGESCTPSLVNEHFRTLPKTSLYNEYGPTEATVWATVHPLEIGAPGSSVAIGRPIPGVRVDVLDRLGRPVPVGIPGEAWITGPTVAQGYWRQPTLTAERFVVDAGSARGGNRYRTGDQVAWTAAGDLLFLGREDEQIKIRGFRIEPGEVEAALLESDKIQNAAVIARPLGSPTAMASETGDHQLVAFVETASPDASPGWRKDLSARLPEHMIPNRLVVLPELPRLPNGKVDRQRLQTIPLQPEAPSAVRRAVLDSRMEALLSLWEGLLGRFGIGVEDNFFELGGHSLLVLEMALAIERDFEVTLSVAEVFENPTVRQLADKIAQQRGSATGYQHLFPIQPTGQGAPFIVAIPHFFTAMFAQRFRNERPVYGLRGVGLRPEGNLGRWRTMTELGEDLVDEIHHRFGASSCIMVGYSFGASMAFEAVRIMEERGLAVRSLYLIAPMPLDFFSLGPLRLQLDDLSRPVKDLSAGEALCRYARSNNPLTLRPYQRAKRRLVIQPWRRMLCAIGRLRKGLGLPLTPRILYADVRVDRFRLHAAYQPRPIRTPTFLFNAQETVTDAAATWRPFFRGPFTVVPTPDPHLDDDSIEAARRVILDHLRDLNGD